MKRFQTFNFSTVKPYNAAGKKAVDVYIDGQIVDAQTQEIYKEWFGDDTSVSYKSFRNQLIAADADIYNIYINSGGGLVTDAMAMHDLLQTFKSQGKQVNTEGRGLIASAATFILMAGDKPKMSSNSWFMIHCVSGLAYGTVNEVEQQAKVLRQFNDRCAKFYSGYTSIAIDDINTMMVEETWMDAETAKEKGFIADITAGAEITNSIKKENWPFANMAVLNSYNAQVVKPPVPSSQNEISDTMKKFFSDLKQDIINAITSAKPAAKEDGSAPDAADISNAIATAIGTAFDNASERFETEANTQVENQFNSMVTGLPKNEAFINAVKDAVTNATKDLGFATTAQFTTLQGDVNKIATQQTGGPTTTVTNNVKQKEPLGTWEN